MKAVVILEVMWDWRNVTSSAGYRAQAPRAFDINPANFTGRRLHDWLDGIPFKVTNACPQLVSSAKGRGTPDRDWLRENLRLLYPYDLIIVCGKVAQQTFEKESQRGARLIEMPHPAMRLWTREGMALAKRLIQKGIGDYRLERVDGKFEAQLLGVTAPPEERLPFLQ